SAPGAITYSIVSPPSHGTLGMVGPTGGVTYTPTSGFGGTDSFTFEATDTHSQASNIATATITVGPNTAPACSNQTISVPLNVAKLVPCSGLTGKKLRACKAKLKLKAALKRCARIKNKTKRQACIKKARHAYHRALQARVSQAHVTGKAPTGYRPPPLLVYQVPRRR